MKKCVIVKEEVFYAVEVEAQTEEDCEQEALECIRKGYNEYDVVARMANVHNMYDSWDEVDYEKLGISQGKVRCKVWWDIDPDEEGATPPPLYVDIEDWELPKHAYDYLVECIGDRLYKKYKTRYESFDWELV